MPLTTLESRVCSAIDAGAEKLLDDLRMLVGIPTGHGHGPGLDRTREHFRRRCEALGAIASLVPAEARPDWLYRRAATEQVGVESGCSAAAPPTLICRREAGADLRLRPVLLAGHLDTVHDPAGAFRELTLAPDGRGATGPGCADMKGGLVIGMAALEALDSCGVRLPWMFLLNSDEETGSFHSAAAIRAEARRIAGLGGVGVALEPAAENGGLVVERAGAAQFVLRARGKSAHVGRDFDKGVSAVNALAAAIVRVAALTETAGPDGQRALVVNFGPLRGGEAANVVPDLALAWGNARFTDDAAAGRLAAGLELVCRETSVGGANVTYEMIVSRPSKPRTGGVEALASAARGAAEDLGQGLPFTRTSGVCDGNLMQAEGLATLDTLGVRGGGLHTTEEWVDVEGLAERCRLLAVWMMRVGGVG